MTTFYIAFSESDLSTKLAILLVLAWQCGAYILHKYVGMWVQRVYKEQAMYGY